MENERKDTANANMARSGYDSGVPQNGERVQRSDTEDGYHKSSTADSSQDTRLLSYQQEPEYAELDDNIADTLASVSTQCMEWSGPLPPPSVFNQYDDKAQDAIIREFERESQRNDKTLEAYRELDRKESERRNAILDQENKKINTALWMTFIINIALIMVVFMSFYLSQPNVAVAALTVLGGVAVSRAFSQRSNVK